METLQFELTKDHIELIKLLKFMNIVSSGGEAKMVVEEGMVSVNGEKENRKRLKLKKGDKVTFNKYQIEII